MVYSTHADFIKGWDDFAKGYTTPGGSVIDIDMWYKGWLAHEEYDRDTEEDEVFLYGLSEEH